MSKWRNYGQAIHPKTWWECALCTYFKKKYLEAKVPAPKVTSAYANIVKYTLGEGTDLHVISKSEIIGVNEPELN